MAEICLSHTSFDESTYALPRSNGPNGDPLRTMMGSGLTISEFYWKQKSGDKVWVENLGSAVIDSALNV
ncbi:unnamed protein product [Lupinus luteus]|uniref:Uncharacterized protein n=1 Tax=Lupinus luteus TaxID=3873 RepID=A0AAV1YLQ4_LUPLU